MVRCCQVAYSIPTGERFDRGSKLRPLTTWSFLSGLSPLAFGHHNDLNPKAVGVQRSVRKRRAPSRYSWIPYRPEQYWHYLYLLFVIIITILFL